MKVKYFLQSAAVLLSSAGMAFGGTISFDDIAAPTAGNGPYPAPPSGYGGLNWNNFQLVDGLDSAPTSGYHFGVVSGRNVAFNPFANPAMVSSAAFDLTSGYFTAAWNDNLKLEVQGFVGAALTFDNTYVLSAVNPTLINFNYTGVDDVKFISSGGTQHAGYPGAGTQFVMDDLTINRSSAVPDAGATGLMFSAALLGLGVLRKKLA